ncbi:MAG: hypothetical protein ABIK07_06365 [Planctomycetota bacterium]
MNADTASQNKWKKILHTPVSQLLRGRITGPQEPLEQLDTSVLPDSLIEAIRKISDRLEGRLRWSVARRLVKSCSSLLREGCAATQLVEQLSEPESIAALIRATRRTDWILTAPLPARLWPTVERIVIHERVKTRAARQMLNRVCQTLQWQLDGGRTPEAIATQCGDAAALSGLVYETHSLGELLEYRLPEPIMAVVLDVVRQSRLWPTEKRDVARELCSHFADGMEQGESEAALIESFGSPKTTAKLIRRARLRNRPFHRRARRRAWQALGILLVLILIPWLILAVRFMAAQPTLKFDVLQEHDKQSRAVPRQERAWPLYLQGLEKLKDNQDFKTFQRYDPAKETISEHWPEAEAFYNHHSQILEYFLQAAKQPQLGYIYRPLTNDLGKYRELNRPYEGNPATRRHANLSITLPHLQDLAHYVSPFLRGASLLAAEQGDGEKCFQLMQARIAVSDHISQVIDCPITYLVFNAKTTQIAQDLERFVEQQSHLFTDNQLTTLFDQLKKTQDQSIEYDQLEHLFIDDFLQKTYTDDGAGNGRFTSSGFQILREVLVHSPEKEKLLASLFVIPLGTRQNGSDFAQTSQFDVMAAPVAALIADRKSMHKKLQELASLLWDAKVAAAPAKSKYLAEYHRLLKSPTDRIRYLPALVLMPDQEYQFSSFQPVSHTVKQEIALTLIAADLFRRAHGRYPESLQELVPAYFSEIPVDPQTCKPLRYQIKEGHPVINRSEKETSAVD